ncbi:MAG: hypothetical protein ACMUIA_08300 [bacterium]
MIKKFQHRLIGSLTLFLFLWVSMAVMTYTCTCQAGQEYDLIAFMNECQKMSGDPGLIAIVQWIPDEWWQITLERAEVPPSRIKEVLALFDPYLTFIVIHGKVSSNGVPLFTDESVIRQHLRLKDMAGGLYRPINDEDISSGVRNAIIMIKPLFSNMLGRMGENMNFFFFSSHGQKGERICQAGREGSFSISLSGIPEAKDQIFAWTLPLNSLLPLKVCPKCGREAQGSWKYCPFCGLSLPSRPRKVEQKAP